MQYPDMNGAVVSTIRPDYGDMPNNATTYGYKGAFSFPGGGRGGGGHSTLSIAEQAELEYELRYRGNMIMDQQRKIQQLEEELRQSRDQVDMMNSQLSTYEQDRVKEKKKPQSRYWTPEEHQRFLEALQKYGHKDVKSISMHVSTRNATQVRTHAQKYFLRLERERRKKEDVGGSGALSGGDGYNSSDDLEDEEDDGMLTSHVASVSISSLTLPGSPAVMSDNISTPGTPGTPGDSTPGTPGTPQNSLGGQPASPVPIRRRRATSFITVQQARTAAQHRESVLVGLPPTWSVEDYDVFMKGLLSMADKQDDVQTMCRSIRDQYLPHHSSEEIEICYRNTLRNIKHKPLAGSPKRRRTNSRPEPLSSSLGIAATLSPSFPVHSAALSSSLASSFPFRNHSLSPPSANPPQAFNSSPSHSPLIQSQSMHSPNSHAVRPSPFADYGQLPNGMEFPLLSDLSLNGVITSPNNNMNMNSLNTNMTMNNTINLQQQQVMQHHHQQQQQQHQQHQQHPHQQHQHQHQQQPQHQHMQGLPLLPNSPPSSMNPNGQMTPNSLWGSALPFSFDALMSGNVSLPQTMPL